MIEGEEDLVYIKAEREFLDDHVPILIENLDTATDETLVDDHAALLAMKGKYESLLREIEQGIADLPSEDTSEDWKKES